MNEERLLQQIFGEGWTSPSGKKYPIGWCDLCDVISITCDKCKGSTCNCGGCDGCMADQKYFMKNCECHVLNYLTKEEKQALDKIKELKRLLLKSLLKGHTKIEFKKLQEDGSMSEYQEQLFVKELQS